MDTHLATSRKGTFLEHITWLRGMAIVLVMLFHLSAEAWPKGYLGVDAFLVISGYLLFRKYTQETERVSLKTLGLFFLHRVQRIVLPMAIIIVLSIIIGHFFLIVKDENFLCREAFCACFARVNSFLQREFSNYFASDSAFNPLLHLWYLAVILQIYFMWGIGRFVVQYLPRVWRVCIVVFVGIASLMYFYNLPIYEYLSGMGAAIGSQPKAVSYYATLPRVWEVLSGGIVYLLPELPGNRKISSLIASVTGLSLVLFSALSGGVFALEWMGSCPHALLVVLGTVLLIRYAGECRMPLLSPLLFLGRISFSVYLVHMPLFIYSKMWLLGQAGAWEMTAFLVAAILVGWVFWWCIEKRHPRWWLVLLCWLAALSVSRAGRKSEGFKAYQCIKPVSLGATPYSQWRKCRDKALLADCEPSFSTYMGVFGLMSVKKLPKMTKPILAWGNKDKKASVILIGDSHASHLYAGFNTAFQDEDISGIYLASIVFPFVNRYCSWQDRHGMYDSTKEKTEALYRFLEKHPEISHIIIAQYWSIRLSDWLQKDTCENITNDLRVFLRELKKRGKEIIIVGPTPVFALSPRSYTKVCALTGKSCADICAELTQEAYAEMNKDVFPMLQQMVAEGLCTYIDPLKTLLPQEAFKASDGEDIYMSDTNHFFASGSELFIRRCLPQLKPILKLRSDNDQYETK